MNSSKTVTMITLTVLIMLLIIPVQSIPTRHKRWTSNSRRLHDPRYTPHAPLNPIYGLIYFSIKNNIKIYLNLESYSPTISTDANYQDQPVNDDYGNSYEMLFRLLRFFQMLDYEQEKNNDYN
jgi:hypothetical protein